jgi:hypothetical protein
MAMNQFQDNLFRGNHRTNIIAKYGYTEAMTVTVDDLNFQAFRPEHDCHLSPMDGCACQLINNLNASI